MPKNLVIVESPAKARTIAKYLGKDYRVMSSFGHVRDLPKNDISVDIKNGFEPTYEVPPDKQKVAKDLKTAAKGATVWLASDEDREGEAIAWHVCILLGLDPAKTKRIVFHEITESAIAAAVAKPRNIDQKLVDAQQARRVLDRLVGYELSPVLWKKVRSGLSAGRVQSVAVRLIVEREREIKAFKPETTFRLSTQFDAQGKEVSAELPLNLANEPKAREFLEALIKAKFKVEAVEKRPGSRNPSPPFTTSTLQQEASRRLGYSVRQTMVLAQRLYENGHITYMRTDSLNLANVAQGAAKKYVTSNYGGKYAESRQYKTKSRGAQEAHEAIRPTHIPTLSAGRDSSQKKLYELIWRRTLASQMAPAKIEKTEARISISNRSEKLIAVGEILVFDGFLKIYGGGKDDKILPDLQNGQELKLKNASALQTYSRAPARYSEAGLVKKLEELGIGRPSTYAPTIGTIQDRGYIEKKDLEGEARQIKELVLENKKIKELNQPVVIGADRSKLLPTELAEIVNDFLIKYFASVLDYDFTAKAEDEFDDIEEGKADWREILKSFYKHFHPLVEKSEGASRAEATKVRKLGKDPKSGEPVVTRFGRFGPVLQLGESPAKGDKEAPKPRFAPMPAGATIEDVTLEQALPMFNLPRTVGSTEAGEAITADIGPYGPYLKVGKNFISLKEGDPLTIGQSGAREVITEHAKALAKKNVADFGTLKILRGPYGPYITDGKKNARVPKETDPQKLSEREAQKMLDAAPDKQWRSKGKGSRRGSP